jgi:hypothetical protein
MDVDGRHEGDLGARLPQSIGKPGCLWAGPGDQDAQPGQRAALKTVVAKQAFGALLPQPCQDGLDGGLPVRRGSFGPAGVPTGCRQDGCPQVQAVPIQHGVGRHRRQAAAAQPPEQEPLGLHRPPGGVVIGLAG